MKQIIQNLGDGDTIIIDVPEGTLPRKAVRISSTVSLISAGTEKMLVSFSRASYLEKARQQPDKVAEVINKAKTEGVLSTYEAVKSKLDEPIPLGYSNVGTVIEVGAGVQGFKVGDRVVSNGPHAEQVIVGQNLCAVVPDTVSDEAASFAVVGSIALQGLRLAEPTIGEKFVVFGTGLIGLLAVQLLRANGCSVLAIDVNQSNLSIAAEFGADTCLATSREQVVQSALKYSKNAGVDGVIITASSPSSDIIKQSAEMSRKRGRIILVGVVGLDIDRSDFYEKELTFQVSCSYGPGRHESSYEEGGIDYPLGFVRWTEQRNFGAILDLLQKGSLDVEPLIAGKFPFDSAPEIYTKLVNGDLGLGTILKYRQHSVAETKRVISISNNSFCMDGDIHTAFIGAGNYATRVLIPAFKKSGANLHTIVSHGGLSGSFHGRKHGFSHAATDLGVVLDNPEINLVCIATRHDTHASIASRCMEAGKNVWVEKPLCINRDQLDQIKGAYSAIGQNDASDKPKPQLMVGFNRRFAPHVARMKELISFRTAPMNVLITVNAGFIPNDHWTQDNSVGGGRIIGEACHFVDLARFLVGEPIVAVSSNSMKDPFDRNPLVDNCTMSLEFADGSVSTIIYVANGAKSFPKERIEIFLEGKTLQLDNFRILRGFGWRGFKRFRLLRQNKGHSKAVSTFLNALRLGVPAIPSEELFEVAQSTLDINDLLAR